VMMLPKNSTNQNNFSFAQMTTKTTKISATTAYYATTLRKNQTASMLATQALCKIKLSVKVQVRFMSITIVYNTNECDNSTFNRCDANATCTKTTGSYVCECKQGFYGNGTECNGLLFVAANMFSLIRFCCSFSSSTRNVW